MEQLAYYLSHTASIPDQIFGILCFILVFIVFPVAVLYLIVRLLLCVINYLTKTNDKKRKEKLK